MSALTHTVAFLAAMATAGPLAWQLTDREPPVTVTDFVVSTPVVFQGQRLIVEAVGILHRDCRSTVEQWVRDGAGFLLDKEPLERLTSGSPDGIRRISLGTVIPPSASPGSATYFVATSYRCNWVHNFWPIIVTSPELRFQIVKADPPSQAQQQQGEINGR